VSTYNPDEMRGSNAEKHKVTESLIIGGGMPSLKDPRKKKNTIQKKKPKRRSAIPKARKRCWIARIKTKSVEQN